MSCGKNLNTAFDSRTEQYTNCQFSSFHSGYHYYKIFNVNYSCLYKNSFLICYILIYFQNNQTILGVMGIDITTDDMLKKIERHKVCPHFMMLISSRVRLELLKSF